jgi:hypothetical protein
MTPAASKPTNVVRSEGATVVAAVADPNEPGEWFTRMA